MGRQPRAPDTIQKLRPRKSSTDGPVVERITAQDKGGDFTLPASIPDPTPRGTFQSGPPGPVLVLPNAIDDPSSATCGSNQQISSSSALPVAAHDCLLLAELSTCPSWQLPERQSPSISSSSPESIQAPDVTSNPWDSPSCVLKYLPGGKFLPSRISRKSFFKKETSFGKSHSIIQRVDNPRRRAALVNGARAQSGSRRSPRFNRRIEVTPSFGMGQDMER